MKNEPIILKWREHGLEHQTVINRKELFDIMDSIRKGFSNDNYVSSVFCEYIPNTVTIFIDQDRNSQVDIPFVHLETDDRTKAVDVRRHNRIMWAILEGYMKI